MHERIEDFIDRAFGPVTSWPRRVRRAYLLTLPASLPALLVLRAVLLAFAVTALLLEEVPVLRWIRRVWA